MGRSCQYNQRVKMWGSILGAGQTVGSMRIQLRPSRKRVGRLQVVRYETGTREVGVSVEWA